MWVDVSLLLHGEDLVCSWWHQHLGSKWPLLVPCDGSGGAQEHVCEHGVSVQMWMNIPFQICFVYWASTTHQCTLCIGCILRGLARTLWYMKSWLQGCLEVTFVWVTVAKSWGERQGISFLICQGRQIWQLWWPGSPWKARHLRSSVGFSPFGPAQTTCHPRQEAAFSNQSPSPL